MSPQFRGFFAGIFAAAAAFAVPVAPALADTTEMPPGSYQRTCREIRTDGYKLYANCKNTAGQYVAAYMADYRNVDSHGIQNCDGKLSGHDCSAPSGNAPSGNAHTGNAPTGNAEAR